MREVPASIWKPDYAETGLQAQAAHATHCHGDVGRCAGIPLSEMKARASSVTPIYTPEQISGIRAACRVRAAAKLHYGVAES